MGCCGSKEAVQEPNETTNLISANQASIETTITAQPQMDAQHYAAEMLAKEAATLNQIVQKTAENLIDISRIHSVDRVKLQDSNLRAEEYQHLINGSAKLSINTTEDQPRLSQIFNLPPSSPTTPTDFDSDALPSLLALSTSPATRSQIDRFVVTSKELVHRLDKIHVNSTNDFVVPLTFTSQTPVLQNN